MERSSSLTLVPSLLYPLQIETWLLKSSEQKAEHHKEPTWNPGRSTGIYGAEPQGSFLRKCCYSFAFLFLHKFSDFLKDCAGHVENQDFLCGRICGGKGVGFCGECCEFFLL